MHIAVCDGCTTDLEETINLLRRYCTQMSLAYDIIPYNDGASLLYDMEDGCAYDILFLAVRDGKKDGMALAHRLRELTYTGDIVVLSSSADFAYESYAINASGYLLKPSNMEKLKSVMDHIVASPDRHIYQVHKRQHIFRIPYQDIAYIESDNSKCTLHSIQGERYTIYKSLTAIEKELHDERFLRCHQSFLVNMHHIRSADTHFEMSNGEWVLIRQRHLKQIRQRFLDYIAPFDGIYTPSR